MELTVRFVLPRFSHPSRRWLVAVLAAVLVLVPLTALASDTFGDVPDSLPQHDAINRVYAAGIMRACTATIPPNFCPNDPVLRAQQASQWDRALGLNGVPNAAVYVGRAAVTGAYRLPGPARSMLDNTAFVGAYSSITIGADGLALISYYDSTFGDLKVAHCSNVACSSATLATLDSTGNVGLYTSIAIGADGLGLISYQDSSNNNLKVAHCSDTTCSAATLATIDGNAGVGEYTSIAIGADGLGLISYRDNPGGDLKVAHCSNAACSSATLAALDGGSVNAGQYTSIAIGVDGLGLISYFDLGNQNLQVAHCSNVACSAATTLTTLDSTGSVGLYTSIAIGADGLGLVSYYDLTNTDLKVAHCSNVACTGATFAQIDFTGDVGWFTAITIGADGLGLISYYDNTDDDLQVAHCSNAACSTATVTTLESTGSVGGYTSITIGADGLGLISYLDSTNTALKTAHCANVACTPFYRSSR